MLDERSRGKAQVFVRVIPSMCHAFDLLSVLSWTLIWHSSFVTSIFTSSSSILIFTFSSSMWMSSEQDLLCISPNEASGFLDNSAFLTGYEPNFFDDFHYSETTEFLLPAAVQRHEDFVFA